LVPGLHSGKHRVGGQVRGKPVHELSGFINLIPERGDGEAPVEWAAVS
jgi:hypothetical protein